MYYKQCLPSYQKKDNSLVSVIYLLSLQGDQATLDCLLLYISVPFFMLMPYTCHLMWQPSAITHRHTYLYEWWSDLQNHQFFWCSCIHWKEQHKQHVSTNIKLPVTNHITVDARKFKRGSAIMPLLHFDKT